MISYRASRLEPLPRLGPFGPVRDRRSFIFRHDHEDAQNQLSGSRTMANSNGTPLFSVFAMNSTSRLGNGASPDSRCLVTPAISKRRLELGAIGPPARIELGELGLDFVAVGRGEGRGCGRRASTPSRRRHGKSAHPNIETRRLRGCGIRHSLIIRQTIRPNQ